MRSHLRQRAALALIVGLLAGACDTEALEPRVAPPADLGRYLAAQGDPLPGGPCPASIDREIVRAWPTDREWVLGIIRRESRCGPSAQNSMSSAAGLMQIVRGSWADRINVPASMTARRASLVRECPWERRYDARCNLMAGRLLYDVAGRSPWRL